VHDDTEVHPATKAPLAYHEVLTSSPFARDYLMELRDGTLLPADKFTAEQADLMRGPHHPLKGKLFDPSLKGAAMFERAPEDAAPEKTLAELHAEVVKAGTAPAKLPPAPPKTSTLPAGPTKDGDK
jgi:hypothetical protein